VVVLSQESNANSIIGNTDASNTIDENSYCTNSEGKQLEEEEGEGEGEGEGGRGGNANVDLFIV
jgi:hypothetical protein